MMIARTFLSRRADCTWQSSAEHKWPILASLPNVSLQESSARHNSLPHVITNNPHVKKWWKVSIVMSQPFINTREKSAFCRLFGSQKLNSLAFQGKQIMRKQWHFKSWGVLGCNFKWQQWQQKQPKPPQKLPLLPTCPHIKCCTSSAWSVPHSTDRTHN